jgi:hypothetical protein
MNYVVYAYIDPRTNEPFYIGRGTLRRAYIHLTSRSTRRANPSPFAQRVTLMLSQGVYPEVHIIKGGLTSNQAWEAEAALIHLVGRQVTGGPLCNVQAGREEPVGGYSLRSTYHVQGSSCVCWGEVFPSYAALSRDYRSEVTLKQMYSRLCGGWTPTLAATTPIRASRAQREVICWGEFFRSLTALSRDVRCVVSLYVLRARVKRGLELEQAVISPASTKVEGFRPLPRGPHGGWNGKKTLCWGDTFPSRLSVARDARCVVSENTLKSRLRSGWSVEEAASTPLHRRRNTFPT